MNEQRISLRSYVTKHHPAVLEGFKAYTAKAKKKKAREYMRSYYKPTGNKPGRPRIEDEEQD